MSPRAPASQFIEKSRFVGPVDRYPYLQCRDVGHTWQHVTDFQILRNASGHITQFSRQVECRVCGCSRHDVYDSYLDLISRRYVYPAGYQTRAEHRIDAASARAEEVRRALGDVLGRAS